MSSTNFAKNKSQDFIFGAISFTPPGNYYLGLSTSTISSSGSNATEPSGANYARVALPNTKSTFTYSSSGCLVNNALVSFPQSSGSWGTIINIGLWDSLTSGSIYYYTTLNPAIVIQANTTVTFSASAITISQS